MPTWIVLRHSGTGDEAPTAGAKVMGSITAAARLEALIAAHSRWASRPLPRLELLPVDEATPAQRYAAGSLHLDLDEERLRLHAIFEDRLSL